MRRRATLTILSIPEAWHARLHAWPGVLTLLSVLAVLLGVPVHVPDSGPRLTPGNVAPALPELRPAPQPGPAVPLPPAPPPEPFSLGAGKLKRASALPHWTDPAPRRPLAMLGRRQTDGG